jgi:hypothetical protein
MGVGRLPVSGRAIVLLLVAALLPNVNGNPVNNGATIQAGPVNIGRPWGSSTCDRGDAVTIGTWEVQVGPNVFYVDSRSYAPSTWAYQESNGIFHNPIYGDLQRGGSSRVVPSDADPCTADPSPDGPDTLIV